FEPIVRKSDVFSAFCRFQAKVENESGLRIKGFGSDNGGEYMSNTFQEHLLEHGITHSTPPPYSPQVEWSRRTSQPSNGVAERVNRTIVEGLLSLLNQSGVPRDFWAEALRAFVFVKNRSPHRALNGRLPLAVWTGRPVNVGMLRVWGCQAWHTTKKIYRSRDARFDENTFSLLAPSSVPLHTPSSVIEVSDPPHIAPAPPARAPAPSPPATPAARHITPPAAPDPNRIAASVPPFTPPPQPVFVREHTPPPATPDVEPPLPVIPESPDPLDLFALVAASEENLEASDNEFSLPTSDPRNHREAMNDSDNKNWRLGEEEEFNSSRRSTRSSTSSIDQRSLRARKSLAVASSTDARRINTGRETFAPVAKFTSIRVLLALAAQHNLKLQQAGVDKAYLYGKLEEKLYMRVSDGINAGEYVGKVLKLERSLYGLKQAGRGWNHRIHNSLQALGYKRTISDACVYVRNAGGTYHYIALYVDDLLFASPHRTRSNESKKE
ncbi:uncharacterized protein JCM6883_001770, partial [Sporobolomyces salmoneus]|uniref:uncharacterized protein n=1 Tax=Sporobolomyces salmoneus TaxID=183962 RepID=UPI003170551B